jgi:predicted Fe-Mo cluster-binding NifX family protein
MKIAVTNENGGVFQHFGHTAQFKLYEVENGAVVSSQVVDTNGSGHGALAGLLSQLGVDCLICGGIGGGAQMALAEAGIRLYAGCSGDADQRVAELLNGSLQFAEAATCDPHHGEDHACGDHGCGGHGEGHSCGHHC